MDFEPLRENLIYLALTQAREASASKMEGKKSQATLPLYFTVEEVLSQREREKLAARVNSFGPRARELKRDFQKALDLSREALAESRAHLPSQLWGRLGHREEFRPFLESLSPPGDQIWLRPVKATLTNPASPLLFRIEGHSDMIGAMVILSHDRTLITASEESLIKVWDLEKRELVRTVNKHQRAVNDICLSLDGEKIYSVSDDRSLKVWSLPDFELVFDFQDCHVNYISAVCPGGWMRALTVSKDETVQLWDLLDGHSLEVFESHTAWVYAVAEDHSGQYAVSAAINNALKVWNLETVEEEAPLFEIDREDDFTQMVSDTIYFAPPNRGEIGHETSPKALKFLPPDRPLLVSVDKEIILWDLKKRKQLFRSEKEAWPYECLEVFYNSNLLALGGRGISLWDWEKRREIAHFRGVKKKVTSLALSWDEKFLVSGDERGVISVWDVEKAKEERKKRGHFCSVHNLRFSPRGTYLISQGHDGRVCIWKGTTGEHLHAISHQKPFIEIWDGPRGKNQIISTNDQGQIRFIDLDTGEVVREISTLQSNGRYRSIKALDHSPTEPVLAIGFVGEGLLRWNYETGEWSDLEDSFRHTLKVKISNNGKWVMATRYVSDSDLATGGNDEEEDMRFSLYRWNFKTGELDWMKGVPPGHYTNFISWYSGDYHSAAVTSQGGLAGHYLEHSGYCEFIESLSKEEFMTLCSDHGLPHTEIKIWSKRDFKCREEITLPLAEARQWYLSPDGQHLLAIKGRRLSCWKWREKREVASFIADGKIFCCAFSPDGQYIAAGDELGEVHLLAVEGRSE